MQHLHGTKGCESLPDRFIENAIDSNACFSLSEASRGERVIGLKSWRYQTVDQQAQKSMDKSYLAPL